MAQVRYERLNTEISRLDPDENDEGEIELDIRRPNTYAKAPHNNDDELNYDDVYGGVAAERRMSQSPPVHTIQNPSQRFMELAIGNFIVILLYLTFSISLILYQRSLVTNYKFPFTIVSYHLVIKYLLASFLRAIYKWRVGKSRIQIDFRTSLRKVAPTGVASAIDIGFSNWGLEIVTVSLYTMTKSSTIIFILIFAILLGLEKKSWLLVFTVGLIAFGLFLFTYESAQFDTLGFIFLLVASLSSGIRWNLAQFVMQKSKIGLHNPIDMMYHMQPWMFVSLIPFFLVFEGKGLYNKLQLIPTTDGDVLLLIVLKITFGAVLAFFMEVSEFLVLSRTSGLTLSIAGIFKDAFLVGIAVAFKHEWLSFINYVGLVICLAGVSCHVLHKYITLSRSAALQALEENSHSFNGDSNLNTPNGVFSNLQRNNNFTTSTPSDKHSTLTIPLLDQMESHESSDDSDGPNASDVIFDVLKRRDMSR